MKNIQLIFLFCFCISSLLTAQEDQRLSEADIQIQDAFVAARFEAISGHPEKGVKILDSLARANRKTAAIHFESGIMYAEMKSFDQAEDRIKKAIEIEPQNKWYHERLAEIYLQQKKYEYSIYHYLMVLDLDLKNPKIYDKLLDLYDITNDQAGALSILEKRNLHYGFSTFGQLKKAEWLERSGSFEQALTALDQLLEKHPNNTEYLKYAARMALSGNLKERAIGYCMQILKIDPANADAQVIMISAGNTPVDKSGFLLSLMPLIENKDIPADTKIKEILPLVEEHAEKGTIDYLPALLKVCESIANTHPKDAKAQAVYGDVLMNNGQTEQAVRQFRAVITLDIRNFAVWEQLMTGLEILNDMESLRDISMKAMDYFPNQAISYYHFANTEISSGNYANATSTIEEAELIAGKNPNILSRTQFLKAKIAFHTGDLMQAKIYGEKSVETSNFKNCTAAMWLALLYQQLNLQENKMQLISKVNQNGCNIPSP